MPHTSEIEKALDDLIIEEAGMKFQALAVVLAKQKWPHLIACERKKDLGLDAYASGELEPDPNRKRSAFALIGQIELWRLEHGRPIDEPRHPAIESGQPWPPLLA